jgi:hypothetical protein
MASTKVADLAEHKRERSSSGDREWNRNVQELRIEMMGRGMYAAIASMLRWLPSGLELREPGEEREAGEKL